MTRECDRIHTNTNKKYIIRNCPCYIQYENSLHFCCDGQGDGECQDCTDCVLKQIVELCRKAPILDADWILNKIEIQEIE